MRKRYRVGVRGSWLNMNAWDFGWSPRLLIMNNRVLVVVM